MVKKYFSTGIKSISITLINGFLYSQHEKKIKKRQKISHYSYGRYGSSTTIELENILKELEQAYHVFLTGTGFGGIALALAELCIANKKGIEITLKKKNPEKFLFGEDQSRYLLIINKKKELCLNAAKKMKIQNLCAKTKIDENDIQLLSDEELNVSKHVIEENLRVVKAAQYLKDNKAEEFGKLMTESHISLSRHYRVSTDNLNKLVDLSNSFGALGSKLTGAGFGGAIVTLVKKELVEELKKYILDGYPNAKFI